jgi:DNA-directed RNA polymerase specialized sigma24 family protein
MGRVMNLMISNLDTYAMLAGRYHPLLKRYALFIIKNNDAASIMATKTLIKLWQQRESIYTVECLRTFLRLATKCYCHDWLHEKLMSLRK